MCAVCVQDYSSTRRSLKKVKAKELQRCWEIGTKLLSLSIHVLQLPRLELWQGHINPLLSVFWRLAAVRFIFIFFKGQLTLDKTKILILEDPAESVPSEQSISVIQRDTE